MTVHSGLEEVLRRTYGIVIPAKGSNTVTDSVSQGHAAGGAFMGRLAEKLPAMPTAADAKQGLTHATARAADLRDGLSAYVSERQAGGLKGYVAA